MDPELYELVSLFDADGGGRLTYSDLLNLQTSDTIIQVDDESPPSFLSSLGADDYSPYLFKVRPVPLIHQKDRYASEVRSLIKEYSYGRISTAGLVNKLNYLLKRAGSRLSLLQIAIDLYEADCSTSTRYMNIIAKFKEFLGLDGPFSGDFFNLFQQVYTKHLTLLNKLQTHKGKVDKKLKSIKTWRRSSNMFFFGAFSIVLIGSVVAAGVSAPPLVTASASVATVPLGSMWKWVNTLWNKYEHKSSVQMEMISAMQVGNYIVIKDLDNIKVLVDKLEANMECMRKIVGFAIREEEHEAMGIAVDEVKNMMNVLGKTIHDLSDHSDKCIRDVKIARSMILQMITKHPSDSL